MERICLMTMLVEVVIVAHCCRERMKKKMLKLWRGGFRKDFQGLSQNMMRRPRMWSSKLFCRLLGIQSYGWSNVRYDYFFSTSTWFLFFRKKKKFTFLFVPLFFWGENAY
jgi:hypothetical protein